MEQKDLKEIIKENLDALPASIQEAIAKINFGEVMLGIQKKYKLPLDKLADLEIEAMIIMLNLDEPENFVNNLKQHLGVTEPTAVEIENDLDIQIFQKIKQSMVEENQNEERLDRDSILNEIENPTPTFAKAKIEEVKPQSHIPEIAPDMTLATRAIVGTPKYELPMQTKNIVEQKLSEPSHITPKETEMLLKKLPQKNSSDPYKEPIE